MSEEIVALAAQALLLAFKVSLPVVAASAIVGVLISLVQAVTHVQDQTLPFLLKLSVATITLFLSGFWMFGEINRFTVRVFDLILKTGHGAG